MLIFVILQEFGSFENIFGRDNPFGSYAETEHGFDASQQIATTITFEEAARRKGVTGENLIKLLEARLDNTVYRMGIAPSRPAARQLVSHKHVTVNGEVVNVPSFQLKPGDIVSLKDKSKDNTAVTSHIRGRNPKFTWVDYNETEMQGTFITYPERESVPENIKEQLIVELYSK